MIDDLAAAGALSLLAFAALGAPVYEEPPVLSADRLLPQRLLTGPHHRVSEVVTSDGFLNTYTIESDFGVFTAPGDDLLRVRLEEIAALAALDEVTRSESFARSAGAAAKQPFDTAAHVVARPGSTLKQLPSGVSRYFRRTARKIEKAARKADDYLDEQRQPPEEPAEDEESGGGDELEEEETTLAKTRQVATRATRRYLGVGRSAREWARRLGVDPYTTNEALRRELDRVASTAAVGSFTVRLATPGLGVVDDLGRVNDLVWTMSGADLEVLNARRLSDMGLGRAEIRSLFDHPAYSPTRLTGLVAALHDLRSVYGRGALVRLAAAADSEEEAFFFHTSAEMLRHYHRRVAPVPRILAGEVWGGGLTAGGTFVLPLALDHLAWTADAATTFRGVAERARARDGVERLELWLAGRASPRAREELERLGYAVEERARQRWLEH